MVTYVQWMDNYLQILPVLQLFLAMRNGVCCVKSKKCFATLEF
jgi:hypothetical protein